MTGLRLDSPPLWAPTREQQSVANAPLDETLMLEGGAGTGRTTALLLRASRFDDAGRLPVLVYPNSIGFFVLRQMARAIDVRCSAITMVGLAARLVERHEDVRPVRLLDSGQWRGMLDQIKASHPWVDDAGIEVILDARQNARERGFVYGSGLTRRRALLDELLRLNAQVKPSDWSPVLNQIEALEEEMRDAGYVDEIGLILAAADRVKMRPKATQRALSKAALLFDDAQEYSPSHWRLIQILLDKKVVPISIAYGRGGQFRPAWTAGQSQASSLAHRTGHRIQMAGPIKFSREYGARIESHLVKGGAPVCRPGLMTEVEGTVRHAVFETGEEMALAIADAVRDEIQEGLAPHEIVIVARHVHVQDLVLLALDQSAIPWCWLGVGDPEAAKLWVAAESLVALALDARNVAALIALAGVRSWQMRAQIIEIAREAASVQQRLESVLPDKSNGSAEWLREVFDGVVKVRDEGPSLLPEVMKALIPRADANTAEKVARDRIEQICRSHAAGRRWVRLIEDLRSGGGDQPPLGVQVGQAEGAACGTWRSLHIAGHSEGWFPLAGADPASERSLSSGLVSRSRERLSLYHAYQYEELGKRKIFRPSRFLIDLGITVEQRPEEMDQPTPLFSPSLRPR